MAYKDTREYIDALEKEGELVRVKKEVDWDLEAGAIVRRTCEKKGPAVLFENITDYPGSRIFGAPVATQKRLAVAMGISPDATPNMILEDWLAKSPGRVKPVVVDKAPCQQNVATGDKIDLSIFPTAMVHDGDGGRFIGTWHSLVTKDFDTDWTNWGMYRVMIHNKRYLGAMLLPHSEAIRMSVKWEAAGKNMPCAVAIGGDPISTIMGAVPVGPGISECDVAGAIRGEPVELVKAKTVDLLVPAGAEIVIEGEIVRGVQVDEGPFGEFTGFRTGPRAPRALIKVSCITWRDDPILIMSNMGVPQDDSHIVTGFLGMPTLLKPMLERERIPFTGISCPPEMAELVVIVGVKKPYNHIAMQVAHAIYGSVAMMGHIQKLIVVDETVDPFNLNEVLRALATQCHPQRGIITFPSYGGALLPYLSLQERLWGNSAIAVFDCTFPLEWDPNNEKPIVVSFGNIYPEDIQKKVLDNWKDYGFK